MDRRPAENKPPPHPSGRGKAIDFQNDIAKTAMLATNMMMEVNAAMSRRNSVIDASCSFIILLMFYLCSVVNDIHSRTVNQRLTREEGGWSHS
jgi:hypothetical protein